MTRRNNKRSADALEALAACLIAKALYPSALELATYLNNTDDKTIRDDLRQFADSLGSIQQRVLSLLGSRDGGADSARVAELEREIAALRSESESARARLSALQREADEHADQIRRANEAHQAERQELNERNRVAQAQIDELTKQLDESQDESRKLKAKSDSYAAALIDSAAAPDDLADEIAEAAAAVSLTGVIAMARERCDRLVIPDAALREIDALESDEKSGNWARELWKGLQALQAYAEESSFFTGGFWEWCQHSSNPLTWHASSQKLAMSESDTVKNDSRLWRMRRFVVDKKVSPNGYQHMEAHLKISEGGGQHIPRLYFHDDVKGKGRTGQVHIGFIGPHRLVPNSQG